MRPAVGIALALLISTFCPAHDRPWANPVVLVHVNQVALERIGPKAAIVEYGGAQDFGRFTVLKDAVTVQTGSLLALPEFTEWGSGRRYFKADFSSIEASGTYRLEVTIGGETTRSPAFAIADNAAFTTTAVAVLDYFRANRYTNEADKRIRVFATQRYVNVWGGWKDAGGDDGKYLSHLSYANFFNPQQTALVVWALAASYESAQALYRDLGLQTRVVDEVFWGADFLHRLLDPEGYFYMTVFDRWGEPGSERMVTGYVGIDGIYTGDYRAAFREGGGVAIAALARASRLSLEMRAHGEFTAAQYLQDAQRAFAHLQKHNRAYCDDGVENIIDDYTALLAAIELYRATTKQTYLDAARLRADHLNQRLTQDGWFRSDHDSRPYYHAVEAGFPIMSLVYYLGIEPDQHRAQRARETIRAALDYQLEVDDKVANPYNYARQNFRIYRHGKRDDRLLAGFFIPHANETGYWWQGESARLASLATAAILGGRVLGGASAGPFGVNPRLAEFAQNQIDWTLGRNPFDMCLLYGFGANHPPSAESAGAMVNGGISNGITGAVASDEGRGIVFAAGPDEENWRWLEQWLPHSTWFLLAVTAMANTTSPIAPAPSFPASSSGTP
jgi:Glycosyl hydrolase family 9/Cellulase N-terminal ig-like domain